MAGRGRGATLPAWMTAADTSAPLSLNHQYESTANNSSQFEDTRNDANNHFSSINKQSTTTHAILDTSISIRHGSSGDKDRKRSRSRENRINQGNSGRRNRSPSPRDNGKVWRPRNNRSSNFDVKPPDGMELPPIGVNAAVNGVPNSFLSYASNSSGGGPHQSHGGHNSGRVDQSASMMLTRHARRIYAGGVPPRATEAEIQDFFNDVVTRALAPLKLDSPPVLKIYLNVEKCYAFVEFSSIELTTACMQLDGIKFDHYTGPSIIRVRRPNDYRPETLPPSNLPIPTLNLNVLGGVGSTVTNGPGKIFVGGLPYNLADEQIMELLGAFGPIKQFHQVRDPGSITSKGYAFCEYMDQAVAEVAISGLNGMQLGEKTLSVRMAVASTSNATAIPAQQQHQHFNGMSGQQQQHGFFSSSSSYGAANSQPSLLPSSYASAAGNSSSFASAAPTRVLQLSNMVTHEDLQNDAEYADIREDVRLECAEHGQVLRVLIPRAAEGFPRSLEGLIFVEFQNANMARSAALVLNGRKFADKTVVVNYFDEDKFVNGVLI